MAGAASVPAEWLEGTPFRSYFIPALFLFVVIGGMCSMGSIALFMGSNYSRAVSLVCSGLLLSWIITQVVIIGYVSWMQPAIFISAVVIAGIAFFLRNSPSATK
jgi:hypothetical protein